MMGAMRALFSLLLFVLVLGACGSSETAAELSDCGANGTCPTDYSCRAVDMKCIKTGTAGAGVTKSAVAPDSHMVDRVSPTDGAIKMDTRNDAAFDLTVTGPITALAIITCDAVGKGVSNQIWDSLVGTTPIPKGMMVSFGSGSQTWQVGVFEGGELVNNADGTIPALAGTHDLRMYASDSGFFKSGTYFRLIAVLPDGSLTYGPVFAYPPGAL
jgi:hypothetical protein